MPWPSTSRHARGYGTAWDKQRIRILERDCGLCQVCLRKGRVTVGNQVDHIIPRAKGGSEDDDNLQTLCGPCHAEKTLLDEGKRPREGCDADGLPINGW